MLTAVMTCTNSYVKYGLPTIDLQHSSRAIY